MEISISHNLPQLQAALAECAKQVPFAVSVAINKTMAQAKSEIASAMPSAFDRPTPWVVNSLRVVNSTKSNHIAGVGFKDLGTDSLADTWRSVLEPNVNTGVRRFKGFEAQLLSMGLLQTGYNVVPGAGATLDAYGNMSRAQINQIMTALVTAGPAKPKKTKGTGKGNAYQSEYWVNRIDNPDNPYVARGIYQHVRTAFGTGIRPVLMFVKRAAYKQRLDFFGKTQAVVDRDFASNFDAAFADAKRTAKL